MLSSRELVRTSKFLSLVLRHRPERADLTLDSAGWVDIALLVEGCRKAGRPITRDQLDEVVETNDKKRFEISSDGLRIRASQGHSIEIDLGYSPSEPPERLYHGTTEGNLASVLRQGLLKRRRHHVHLSLDRRTAAKVGQRHGRPVILEVSSGRMHADGYAFFVSTNGVWLTEHVPPAYLEAPADDASGPAGAH